ncbi:MAG: rRNA pseudouridine synthase [Oscillospiraceae bacterium]|nr:rRNA pseudouridine synthase [Oscillospiraceae bacterium]
MDKLLAARTEFSRKDAKKLIWTGRVRHNGKIAVSPDAKVDLEKDTLELDGKMLLIKEHLYLMMNKPAGVLSAARDPKQPTVLDLVPAEYRRTGLFPAGRLDKDTEGFVLITDDGDFAHRILAPKKHVPKTYHARIDGPVTEQMLQGFAEGVQLEDETEPCLPAQLRLLQEGDEPLCEVVLTQGMFHQVKRMFLAYGRRVLWLKRVAMGGLMLDDNLASGQCREILDKEIEMLLGKI